MAIGETGIRIASGNPPPVPNLKTRGSSWSKEVTNDNCLTSSASRASSADPNLIEPTTISGLLGMAVLGIAARLKRRREN